MYSSRVSVFPHPREISNTPGSITSNWLRARLSGFKLIKVVQQNKMTKTLQ
jgi:hypothetical protein